MADTPLRRIESNRKRRRTAVEKADAELPALVRDAFAADYTWQQIAEALGGLTKQRVYQLKAQGG